MIREELLNCPECGSGDILKCSISVRPYCNECNYWGSVNHGTMEDAIKEWNKRSEDVGNDIEKDINFDLCVKKIEVLEGDLAKVKDKITDCFTKSQIILCGILSPDIGDYEGYLSQHALDYESARKLLDERDELSRKIKELENQMLEMCCHLLTCLA